MSELKAKMHRIDFDWDSTPEPAWVLSCEFCSKFHTLSSSAKLLKIGQDLTKLQSV